MNVEKKLLNKNFEDKSESVKGGPFKHTKTFFSSAKCFFFYIYRKCILYQLKKNHKNIQVIKKKEIIDRNVFKL